MSDSAGTRIGMGIGIIALVVVLGFIVERVAGGGTTREPESGTSADTPTALQFCVAWQQLSSLTRSERSAEDAEPADARSALEHARGIGIPEAMPEPARAGYRATLDRIEGELDRSFVPTAYPADPAEDEAFSTYLTEYCPS